MLPAPQPADEAARLDSLRRMQLLSTPDEAAFDRVTRTAQRLFQVPIALFSLIDAERQWFKSCVGLPVRETGRDISFCGHAILHDDLFVIENALNDPRFVDNPIVTGPPHVVFYAGRPIKNNEGFNVGTLCIIDHQPRVFSPADRESLADLGYWLESVVRERKLGDSEREMVSQIDALRRHALLHPVLNIWHREAILDLLKQEVDRCFQTRRVLGLVRIELRAPEEIDNPVPLDEAALMMPCKSIRASLRSFDGLGYLGQTSFLAILPDAHIEAVHRVSRRLIQTVELLPLVAGDQLLTLHARVSCLSVDYQQETPDAGALMARLEQAAQRAWQMNSPLLDA